MWCALALLPFLLVSTVSQEAPLCNVALVQRGVVGKTVAADVASAAVGDFVLYKQGETCSGPYVGTGTADTDCPSDIAKQTPACDRSGNEKCRALCEANSECKYYTHLRSINYCFFTADCDETENKDDNCNDPLNDQLIWKKVPPSNGGCAVTEVSDDCATEFDNAMVNDDLKKFYERCENEGGANPLRSRCSLCCRDHEGQRP